MNKSGLWRWECAAAEKLPAAVRASARLSRKELCCEISIEEVRTTSTCLCLSSLLTLSLAAPAGQTSSGMRPRRFRGTSSRNQETSRSRLSTRRTPSSCAALTWARHACRSVILGGGWQIEHATSIGRKMTGTPPTAGSKDEVDRGIADPSQVRRRAYRQGDEDANAAPDDVIDPKPKRIWDRMDSLGRAVVHAKVENVPLDMLHPNYRHVLKAKVRRRTNLVCALMLLAAGAKRRAAACSAVQRSWGGENSGLECSCGDECGTRAWSQSFPAAPGLHAALDRVLVINKATGTAGKKSPRTSRQEVSLHPECADAGFIRQGQAWLRNYGGPWSEGAARMKEGRGSLTLLIRSDRTETSLSLVLTSFNPRCASSSLFLS
eukprot:766574-Hanusia_phi.AAC.4